MATINSDIEHIAIVNLELGNVLITKIEAKKDYKFKDPHQ